MRLTSLIKNLNFKNKLFLGFSTLFIVISIISASVILYNIKIQVKNQSILEMKRINRLFVEMTKSTVKTNIKNHLKMIAAKNLEIIKDNYKLYKQGKISLEQAKLRSRKYLLSQKIGDSGYLYCLDSKGLVTLHPNKKLQDTSVIDFQFVKDQVKLKEGYIEYDWKNPGEKKERKKALYMKYFKPWDWIVSVSSYRNEFAKLININDLNLALSSIKFGETGYFYIINSHGYTVFHPKLSGKNVLEMKDSNFAKIMIKNKKGVIIYNWKNPDEKIVREKIATYDYIPIFDWIVASSGYTEEIFHPFHIIIKIFIFSMLPTILLILLASRWLSHKLTNPIHELTDFFESNSAENLNSRIIIKATDEIGNLSKYINNFLDRLENSKKELEEEIKERISIEKKTKQSQQNLKTIFNKAHNAYFIHDIDGTLLDVNNKMLEMYNVSRQEALTFTIEDDYSSDENNLELLSLYWNNVNLGKPQHFEWIAQKPHTEENFPVQVHLDKIFFNQKEVILATVNDITLLKKVEEQLRQSQKMEVIGNLAGGLAHDFNNVLAGIIGTLSLVKHKLENNITLEKNDMLKYIHLMSESGDRAANLVKNLLTLSRKQSLEFSSIDLNEIIDHIVQLGKSTFHKQVILRVRKYLEPAYVMADANQMEQVLLNFCINADHAMTIMRDQEEKWGGVLAISIDKVIADDSFTSNYPEAVDDAYYIISVEDKGVGIEDNIMHKIFNPFFSTKDKSNGSGLGLSMVYNIVKQHNGFIDVKTEKGIGSIFNLFLPIHQYIKPLSYSENSKENSFKGEGVILIIDDEDIIHDITKEMLNNCGYDVISAFNGTQGLEIYDQNKNNISAVLLDMSMPGISGKETYIKLKEINPEIKVLLASGFRQDERVERVLELGVNAFLQKPFTFDKLSKAIAEVLG